MARALLCFSDGLFRQEELQRLHDQGPYEKGNVSRESRPATVPAVDTMACMTSMESLPFKQPGPYSLGARSFSEMCLCTRVCEISFQKGIAGSEDPHSHVTVGRWPVPRRTAVAMCILPQAMKGSRGLVCSELRQLP